MNLRTRSRVRSPRRILGCSQVLAFHFDIERVLGWSVRRATATKLLASNPGVVPSSYQPTMWCEAKSRSVIDSQTSIDSITCHLVPVLEVRLSARSCVTLHRRVWAAEIPARARHIVPLPAAARNGIAFRVSPPPAYRAHPGQNEAVSATATPRPPAQPSRAGLRTCDLAPGPTPPAHSLRLARAP